ncbi:MAG: four helix bundle protein [Akkermansia sp.]|nr:four helix bundle protein [Akkermansia sp.]
MSAEFKERTFQFSLRIIRLVEKLPSNVMGDVFGRQLLRCATSVGANYRAASRAKSDKDFLNKMKICEEESDESLYWLELIKHAELVPTPKLQPLIDEADELCAIITATCKTTAAKIRKS